MADDALSKLSARDTTNKVAEIGGKLNKDRAAAFMQELANAELERRKRREERLKQSTTKPAFKNGGLSKKKNKRKK